MVDTPDALAVPPEAVHVVSDAVSGLEGVIVLHSTRRGPAAGGCRLWRYADRAALTADALRLAEGMAYKNALADLPLGGGKAVLNLPDGGFDRRRLFAAFGRAVDGPGKRYARNVVLVRFELRLVVLQNPGRFVRGLESCLDIARSAGL